VVRIANFLCAVIWLFAASVSWGQSRTVQLDVIVASDEMVGAEHDIMESLERVGADNVRISRRADVPRPKVEEIPAGNVVTIRVTAVAQGKQIFLPGSKFARTDVAGIKQYIQKLRDDGANVALAEKKAFGLTSEQLVAISEELSQPYPKSTQGASTVEVLETIKDSVKIPLVFRGVSLDAETLATPVADELQNLSMGTVLAATMRPLGIVVVPYREQGKTMELRIESSKTATEFWPVGWPHEGKLSEIAPTIYDKLDINIQNFVLADALTALQRRIGLPMVFDYNSMAEKRIDIHAVIVTFERKKSPHFITLEKVLLQAKPGLRAEVRTDEAGQAFIWIY
jgi:hypothetical protein